MMYSITRSITIVSLALAAGWAGVNLGNQELPIRVQNAKVLTPNIQAGDVLRIAFKVDRVRPCAVRVDRTIIDSTSTRFTLPDFDLATIAPLGEDSYIAVIQTPDKMSPGRAVYRSVATFTCNPFNMIWPLTSISPDREFNVVPGRSEPEAVPTIPMPVQ